MKLTISIFLKNIVDLLFLYGVPQISQNIYKKQSCIKYAPVRLKRSAACFKHLAAYIKVPWHVSITGVSNYGSHL